ncbi:MAG: hypothetical protein EBV06_14910 [Planctomycetia bacterium]|nr:hypothetical protein [Planctomycetia bacterium]
MFRRIGSGLLVALFFASLSGCQKVPPPIAEAEGEVTYDGKPVPNGIISFIPEGTERATGGGAILAGRYRVYPEVGLAPGKYRVEIRWAKATGEKKKEVVYGHSSDIFAEALPEKYNTQSVLTAELIAGKNDVPFLLEK